MNLYEAIEKRRTIREWEQRPVEDEKLHRILEAGLKAPSHNHLRDWHYLRVTDADIRRALMETGAYSKAPDTAFLEETVKKLDEPLARDVYRYSVPIQERMILGAPELLAVCYRSPTPLKECRSLFDLNALASAWLVVENILLAMVDEGLYGVTMVPFRTEKLRSLLGIPGDYEVATLLALGYPLGGAKVKQVQVRLADRLHVDKW